MKRCFKCGLEKPLDDFYKHPQMGDGHLGKCKDCTKLDMRIDRETKPRVREYDRQRANLPHRVALRKRVSDDWYARFPERKSTHGKVKRAVENGTIEKPELCEGCGLPRRLEGHHPDYLQPLLVVWLCKPCHAIADKIRRRLEESSEKAS